MEIREKDGTLEITHSGPFPKTYGNFHELDPYKDLGKRFIEALDWAVKDVVTTIVSGVDLDLQTLRIMYVPPGGHEDPLALKEIVAWKASEKRSV